ncbi:MAG: nickel-dependent lactate racemase [Clostridiaceae bacterium]|nr:nickel-dependent lactate racemase [Clostridiaceae bacterium]
MEISVAIDKREQTVEIPDERLIALLTPNEVSHPFSGEEAVCQALRNPIGTAPLDQLVQPGERIVIVTSDVTRPLPSKQVLSPILQILQERGCDKTDITIVFALGSHRPHREAEMRYLVGDEIFERYTCVDSDLTDVVHLGTTSGGTPIDVTRIVAEADRRICLGNIEYHYFAGYSGGAKAIMPGVSTRAAIQANHSRMVEAGAVAGELSNNPVRRDLEEAIDYCPIDFIVNVVLDEHKDIIHAVAGHFIEAHRAGCDYLDRLYLKNIPRRADIVIVSQGGYPKDLNLYQTQKALDNAKHAVADGGIIILVGSCKEGLGEAVFEQWLTEASHPSDLVARIRSDFKLGGHKAAAIALVLEKADIFLVSDLEPDFVRTLFMEPFDTVQSALDQALAQKGSDAGIIVMPYGGSTLPRPV